MERVECIVVGAGVVGLAVARRLALDGIETLVLEREAVHGAHTSSRNSEVIHAGLYHPPGSLKARLCVRGREQLYRYCVERGIAQHDERAGGGVGACGAGRLPVAPRWSVGAAVAARIGCSLSRTGSRANSRPVGWSMPPASTRSGWRARSRVSTSRPSRLASWPRDTTSRCRADPHSGGSCIRSPAADFCIQGPERHGVEGLVNLYGIESPGLTAALAIADEVAARLGTTDARALRPGAQQR